jgi:hypothetical protein
MHGPDMVITLNVRDSPHGLVEANVQCPEVSTTTILLALHVGTPELGLGLGNLEFGNRNQETGNWKPVKVN